ncbi:MAG: GTPase ObgE [Opitutales bacterium]
MFIDQAHIRMRAGDGGNGVASFRREKFIPYGGPDGGDGGSGGNVYALCDENVGDLEAFRFTPFYEAGNGKRGGGRQKTGINGQHKWVKFPPGTIFINPETGHIICELLKHGEEILILKGGKGGLGNIHFKNSVNQAPRQHTLGEEGEYGEFDLILKTISDIGLVGFPNAGKSSLINLITMARPKVADYPFTTLHVNVGMIKYEETYDSVSLADIPGLIEGASENKGLGHRFLRHIERCKALLMMIDMAGVDERKPTDDYLKLRKELELYDKSLLDKKIILVANKMDEDEAVKNLKKFKKKFPEVLIHELSCLSEEGIAELKDLIYKTVKERI